MKYIYSLWNIQAIMLIRSPFKYRTDVEVLKHRAENAWFSGFTVDMGQRTSAVISFKAILRQGNNYATRRDPGIDTTLHWRWVSDIRNLYKCYRDWPPRRDESWDIGQVLMSHESPSVINISHAAPMPLWNLEEPVPSSTAFFPQLPSLGRVAWNVRGIWNIENVREMCPDILRTCETYDIFKRVFRGLGMQSALKCKKPGALAPYFQIINFFMFGKKKILDIFWGKVHNSIFHEILPPCLDLSYPRYELNIWYS